MKFEIKTASEYCQFVTDGTHDSPKAQEKGRFLITSKHLGRHAIDFSTAKLISESDYQKIIERSAVEQWDILFSMIGTIGNVYIESTENTEYACKNMGIFKLGGNEQKAKWLYYYLQSPKCIEYVLGMARGTTQGYVPLGALRLLPIEIPSDDYRDKVVDTLWNVDEKIKTNTAINKNLEEQLQLLFQHTFLDAVHDDWPIKRLGDYLSLNRGLSYKGKYLSENEGVPMINLGNILPNSVFREEKLKFYTGEFKEKVVVKPGDVVVANTDLTQALEVLGSAITIPDLGYTTMICSHHISIVKDCTISKHFILGMLNSPSYRERVISFATGTTVLALPSETILNCEFALPPEKIVMEYDSFAELVRQKSEQLRKENLQLNSLRDNLLPKLMSGELDVSEISI